MAKPLRIGAMIDVDQPFPGVVDELRSFAEAGFDHAFAAQVFGPDPLTLLAAAGAQVPGIGLGTGVVPVHPRHPMMLAAQALTVQEVTDNRLILGIGLSHQVMVEGIWGMSFDKPARYMKEYLASLMPLLRGETVSSTGERVTTTTPLPSVFPAPPPRRSWSPRWARVMLKLAGTVADGTVTWMTGTATIGNHIVPTIRAAAEAAGRPEPRVGVCLPVSVTNDVEGAKERINQAMAIYPTSALLQGDAGQGGCGERRGHRLRRGRGDVAAAIGRLADAGATDFVGALIGDAAERERGFAVLSEIARS